MNMSKEFKPQLTLPEKGNKYYIRKPDGYSTAILGNNNKGQRSKDFTVLPNCVGWAVSRFHHIAEDSTFSLLKACNAEDFITYANKSLKVGQTPKIGACMVWAKGKQGVTADGCGHVAIVEKVVSSTEVITSESGWSSSKIFWNQTRKKGTGNWSAGNDYKFLGFIYNPAPCCQDNNITTNTSTSQSTSSTSQSTPASFKASEVAKKVNKTLSGTYIITAKDGLNIRDGAGTEKKIFITLPYNLEVRCYGYYNLVGNTKWLYVVCTYKGVEYTGYCSEKYLKKK